MKYLPFDLEIYDHPSFDDLNAFQKGIARLVIEYCWKRGRDIPESDYLASKAITMDVRNWVRYKPIVMPVVNQVMDKLLQKHARRTKNRLISSENISKGRLRRISQKVAKNPTFSDDFTPHTGFTPLPVRQEFNDGKSDKTARLAALDVKLPPGDNTFAD